MADNSSSSRKTKPLILVVDDQSIVREPIAARLAAEGYQVVQAEDGQRALSLMRRNPPDLVLLDVAMPNMNGLAVLQAMRKESPLASVPVIMLTAIRDRRVLTSAAQFGVRDYLLKTGFSLSEMMTRVAKYASGPGAVAGEKSGGKSTDGAEALEILLTRDQCLARVEKALEGRSLSGIVTEVLRIVNSPRAEMNDLASVIGRDPALTARVLHTANSAAFRGARKMVTTLPEAVIQLGCGNIRNITMTLGVVEVMPSAESGGFDPVRSWQHSFAVALLAEHLCIACEQQADSAVAYVVGLCHDLGGILFRTEFAKEYAVIMQARNSSSIPLDELEERMLGIKQGELAEIILKKLGLPDNIRQPIEQFHSSRLLKPQAGRPTCVLRMADLFANGMLMASSVNSPVAPLPKAVFHELFKKEDPPLPDVDSLRAQILALTGMLANLPAVEQAKLTQPLIKPTRRRTLYIRDAIFSAFDPMAAALKLLAEVTTFAKLPDKIDPATYDAVVLARSASPPEDVKTPLMHINPEAPSRPSGEAAKTSAVPAVALQDLANFLSQSNAKTRAAA